MRRTCPVCGKVFEAKTRQKFCSVECFRNRGYLIERVCQWCGKTFKSKGRAEIKYCSTKCREEAVFLSGESKSICWVCQKYAGECSWSKSFVPIEGWVAKPVKIDSPIQSYKVKQCPEFEKDLPRRKI